MKEVKNTFARWGAQLLGLYNELGEAEISPSTAVADMRYDEKGKLLFVHFHSKTIYVYFEVPRAVYKELATLGDTPGKSLGSEIHNRFNKTDDYVNLLIWDDSKDLHNVSAIWEAC